MFLTFLHGVVLLKYQELFLFEQFNPYTQIHHIICRVDEKEMSTHLPRKEKSHHAVGNV